MASIEVQLLAKAHEIVEGVLAPYRERVSASVLAEMRAGLLDLLLHSPEGRARLRRSLPDPVVAKSEEVVRVQKASADPKRGKAGTGT